MYDIWIFSKIQYKWLNQEDYVPYAYLQNFDTIVISLEQWKIYLLNDVKNEFIQKYNDVINWKIWLKSKEFEQINTYWRKYNNIFNLRWNFAQTKPFNQEFIFDKKWKIKWIWFYCFEWQDIPWNLKYKIYSVKEKALMEVDLNIVEEYSWDNFSQTMDKNTWDINLENYKKIFFKNGYFEDDSKSKEYWLNLKNEIEFYKEVVKNS